MVKGPSTPNPETVVLVGGLGGVYRTINPDAKAVWTEYGGKLPNVLVTDLEFNATDNVLVAGTFGRSRGRSAIRSTRRWRCSRF